MTEYTIEVSTACGVETHTILARNSREARQAAADFSDAPISKARVVKRVEDGSAPNGDPVRLQKNIDFGDASERP